MPDLFQRLAAHRLVPIITAGLNAQNANSVGDALIAGGLPVVEVTLRTKEAIDGLAVLAKRSDLTVGTGTVLTLDQAKASLDAGAQYLVAPGLDMEIVEWAQAKSLPIIPGATTATEITTAYKAGLRVLKFFPAEPAGGLAAMTLFAGPFTGVKFVPTGGITFDMLPSYFACPHVLAVGQGSLMPKELLQAGRFDELQALIRRAAELASSGASVKSGG